MNDIQKAGMKLVRGQTPWPYRMTALIHHGTTDRADHPDLTSTDVFLRVKKGRCCSFADEVLGTTSHFNFFFLFLRFRNFDSFRAETLVMLRSVALNFVGN